jgi:hypothetical protein
MPGVISHLPDDRDADRELLDLAERRRDGSDQFTWTVPGLALTAEAFLLTVALAGDTAPLGRLLAVIAGVVCLASAYHFLRKQSFGFTLYDAVIERQRERLGLISAHREKLIDLDYPNHVGERLVRASSGLAWTLPAVRAWRWTLLALIALDLVIGGYSIYAVIDDPGWLSTPSP